MLNTRRRWQLPPHVTQRVQIIFLGIALAQLVLCLVRVTVVPVSLGRSMLAVAAMVVLGAVWVHGQRRGRFPLWLEPCEAAMVALIGLGLGAPSAVLGIVFSGLAYRSLFGRHGVAFVRGALYVTAVEAVVLTVGTRGDAIMEPARMLSWIVPALFLSAITTRALAAILEDHERSVDRERTVSAMGQALFTVHDEPGIARLTRRTARSLAGMPAGAVIDVELGSLPRDGHGAGGGSAAAQRVCAIDLDGGNGRVGTLTVASPTRLPQELHKSLMSVANQAAMAIEAVRLRSQLSHKADHDALTSLPNRALFARRLEEALAECEPTHRVAVLFIDLDDFKTVNDGLGHAAGDELLRAVARRLDGAKRRHDLVARLGGDEFAVLLHEVHEDAEVVAVGSRLLEVLQAPFKVQGARCAVSSSIGMAVSESGLTADELLRNADIAMYVAKARGKGRCALFATDMHSAINDRLMMKARLEDALENQSFDVHYQPIIDVATREITGCEALLRWNDQQLGMVPPLDFIPLAESTGLIIPIEQWVLQRVCTDAVAWPLLDGGRELEVSVNMSVAHLMHHGVVDDVARALEISGLDPRRLVVELTESVAASDASITTANIRAMKELGVRIALDDFGTGYSSLGILSTFPVDILKIDKSFIDSERSTLAKAVVDMSAALGLHSVAEGVESETQLAWLSEFGCAAAQGFYFSRPVPGAELPALIRRYGSPAASAAPIGSGTA